MIATDNCHASKDAKLLQTQLIPRPALAPSEMTQGQKCARRQSTIHFDLAERCYGDWPAPTCIVSDGPYGVNGFPGDMPTATSLAEWYLPHIRTWSRRATAETTLWFWSTEVGWANIHPLLVEFGWEYRCCNIWDKGLGHVAGNANTRTLRKFPVVTEVCAHYVKSPRFESNGASLTMQEWLRSEWKRTGLPFKLANEACGVANAATRKYLTADHHWYYPPVDAFARLVLFANEHGDPRGRPYFSMNGRRPIAGDEWARMRAKFSCGVGITNVWRAPQVGGSERTQGHRSGMRYKFRSLHGSQKPLRFIEMIVEASTESGDVVWEPFGGLCPGAVVSYHLDRRYFGAEMNPEFFRAAADRLRSL